MATRHVPPSDDRSRVRFMLVDFDGSSSDLQQLAQTFASAVKAPPTIVTRLPAPTPPSPPSINAPATHDGHNVQESQVHVHEEEATQVPEVAAPVSRQQNGAPRRKLKTPSIVSGLEFKSGAKPLKDYVDEQAPEEHSKRYLVIVQWLKEYRNITDVGANHIYSCYRFLGLTVPEDVLSVFRGLKKLGWVERGSAPSTYRITHVGEGQLKATPPD